MCVAMVRDFGERLLKLGAWFPVNDHRRVLALLSLLLMNFYGEPAIMILGAAIGSVKLTHGARRYLAVNSPLTPRGNKPVRV